MLSSYFLLELMLVVVVTEAQLPIEERCDQKYIQRDPQHTACLPAPEGKWKPDKEGVSMSSMKYIVNLHNYFRRNVQKYSGQPAATNMQKMYWDDELAMIAQKWASNCYYDHDESGLRAIPGSYGVGQNIGRGHRGWGHLIRNWHSEYKDLEFGVGKTGDQGPIGHYTQMVWADTARIGCGYAKCNRTQPYYVCNYGPAGNMRSDRYKPYYAGATNASCPNSAKSGLCDCKGKVCLNGGTLNLDTCTCDCLNKPWIKQDGGSCALDCRGAEDSFACASNGGRWGLDACARYVNVPSEYCPITCQLCPDPSVDATPALPTPILPTTNNARWPDMVKTTPRGPTDPILPNTRQTNIMDHNNVEQTTPAIPTVPVETTLMAVRTTRRARPRSTTKKPYLPPVISPGEPECDKADSAMCGQPSSTGYYNSKYCMFYQKSLCPAMCGHCKARKCKDYENRQYNIGDMWMNEYGMMTCTPSGVDVQRGCYISSAKYVISPGGSHRYVDGQTTWTCTCSIKYSMSCQGITRRWVQG